jgi:hypothetical protein
MRALLSVERARRIGKVEVDDHDNSDMQRSGVAAIEHYLVVRKELRWWMSISRASLVSRQSTQVIE